MPFMEALNFHIVGYGCTTCIATPAAPTAISNKVNEENLVVCSVLSGNRNFEGRIGPDIKANYLMSPPLVVAYALAERLILIFRRIRLARVRTVLRFIWPTSGRLRLRLRKQLRARSVRAYSTCITRRL